MPRTLACPYHKHVARKTSPEYRTTGPSYRTETLRRQVSAAAYWSAAECGFHRARQCLRAQTRSGEWRSSLSLDGADLHGRSLGKTNIGRSQFRRRGGEQVTRRRQLSPEVLFGDQRALFAFGHGPDHAERHRWGVVSPELPLPVSLSIAKKCDKTENCEIRRSFARIALYNASVLGE
jgi:hypothetical protein